MATNRVLQLLRSNTLYVPTGEGADAKTAKQNAKDAVIKLPGRKDGEMLLARYQETGADIKSLLCIYHANPDLNAEIAEGAAKHWTFIEDASSSEGSSAALQTEVNAIESSVGLGDDGSYVVPQNTNYIGKETDNNSVMTDLVTLDTQVKNVKDRIDNLNKTADVQNGQVVTTVTQENGLVSETKANVKDLQLGGYAKDVNVTGSIGSTDTVNTALSKLENAIAANAVVSEDGSIDVNTGTNGDTNIQVNVDGTTLVKNSDTGVISSDLKILKETTNLEANVREQYKLVYGSSTTAIGEVIKVYKDSSLHSVQLGTMGDRLPNEDANQKSTSPTITPGTGDDALVFVYYLGEEDKYQRASVNVESFLTDSEYGIGLAVEADDKNVANSKRVYVLKDTTSGKVRTAAGDNGLVDVLTVSSDGVKVDNIQEAINYAVQNASTSLAVTAKGDDYVSASVDANTDNKHVVVETNVQALTATAGTPGVYDSTTGAETTAPVAGTLSGAANSLGDAADIASKVKTYVDGKIAIEAARANAQVKAEENRATTAETAIDTAVGLGSNHTYSNSGTYIGKASTNTVTSDIAALDTAVSNTLDGVEGIKAIDVTTKSNKSQTISLILDGTTQGNGHENTGADNALTITDNGLFLSTTWDCGVY